MAKRMVYFFGNGEADGDAGMKESLGGKGANLAEMTRLGIPVPSGFTISADVCHHFAAHKGKYPDGLSTQAERSLRKVQKVMGSKFGDARNPLLVSVRSGAAISMPGMMDTVLNLGLNDVTVEGLAARAGDARFAWDCYRRFVQMYGDVVMGVKAQSSSHTDPFELELERKKAERGVHLDTELSVDDLKELVARFKAIVREQCGKRFPDDPTQQLWGAIGAVFSSWNNPRANTYRKLNGISEGLGTAVNVQAMVYGNTGETSGTGVAFTRNPANGEKELYGEYLVNAQGEDVVAGTRTPQPIAQLAQQMPKQYKELDRIRKVLEKHYREMQDVEFTVQQGKLWMLQTRSGKRTGMAAVRIAVDMAAEKLITPREALMRVQPDQLNQLLRPIFDPRSKESALSAGRVLAKGLPAGPGAASGVIAFSAEEAVRQAELGKETILVRIETSPEDIEGMAASLGILTSRGGMTSHAALVGRQMGKVCVVGCAELVIDYSAHQLRVGSTVLGEGDRISIDGTTGEVIAGEVTTLPSEVIRVILDKTLSPKESPVYQRYAKLLGWADKFRRLKVRANSDTGEQSSQAVALGAEGIGLCRTEHMFFGAGKIEHVQSMILSNTEEERRAALARLLPIQRQDFREIFEAMAGRPVTIRLLDPPLHEFLPHTEEDQRDLARTLGVSFESVRDKVEELHEFNPMLGFRGCRLGVVHPEIPEMQARAIFEAASEVREAGGKVLPEVMVPLIGHAKEFNHQEEVIRRVAAEVRKERKTKFPFMVGTMIEIPRAALTADEVAERAEFFSFGTNDLTQTGLGLSRDDSGRFLPVYVDQDIYPVDPFQSLDASGVGQLVEIACQKGREARPDIKLGICGEHGGDPASVGFFHDTGLDYVSCSPYRLPIARVAAAQAALREEDRAAAAAEATKAARKPKAKAKAKKAASKKAASRKAKAKKAARKASKKAAARKPAAKEPAAKKKAAKKPAAKKKAVSKKPAARKPAARKGAPSRKAAPVAVKPRKGSRRKAKAARR